MSSKLEIVLSVMSQGMEGFTKAGEHVDGLKKKTDGLSKATDMLKTPIAAVAIAAAAAAVAMKSLNEGMQLGGAIQDQANALSISTDAVQEWNYVAKQSGGSAEDITNSFGKLTKNIYDASTGNEKLAKTFKDWNISLTDTNGNLRDVESITNDTMVAISGIKDPIERAGVATELLGKGSKNLLPMLAGGTDAMNAQRKAAGDLGQVLSEHAIKALDDAGDTMDTFNQAMKVANAEMVSNLAPAFTTLATLATKAMSAVGGLAKYIWSIGEGFTWLAKGQDEWEKKMQESNAIGDEVKEMAALKKEYEETIVAQEALKKSGGSLFAPDELWQARQGLEAVNEQLHLMNTPKAQAANEGLRKNQTDNTDEKAKALRNKAHLALQKAFNTDQNKLENDAKNDYLQSEKEKLAATNLYETAQFALITNKYKKERTELDKWHRDELIKNKSNQTAMETIDKAFVLRGKKIDRDEKDEAIKTNEEALQKITDQKKKASDSAIAIAASEAAAKSQLARDTGYNTLASITSTLQGSLAKHGEAAKTYKAMAIGMTIIDTIKGAQSSYNALAGITIVGPALGFIAAAAAVAAGAYRVAEIKKQNFASGTNGPLQQGTWGIVGEMGPELLRLPGGSQIENHNKTTQMFNNSKNGGTTIHLTIYREDGTTATKLTRAIRNGSADYALKQIKKSVDIQGLHKTISGNAATTAKQIADLKREIANLK